MTYQPTTAVTDTASYTQYAGFLSQPKYAPDIAAGTATTDALIGFASSPLTRKSKRWHCSSYKHCWIWYLRNAWNFSQRFRKRYNYKFLSF